MDKFKQGYAKAQKEEIKRWIFHSNELRKSILADVTKIIESYEEDETGCMKSCSEIIGIKQEIAKLSHSPQKSEAKVDNTSNTSLRGVTKFKEVRYAKSSSPSGDTHIRKEKPDCFLGGVPVKEKK